MYSIISNKLFYDIKPTTKMQTDCVPQDKQQANILTNTPEINM